MLIRVRVNVKPIWNSEISGFNPYFEMSNYTKIVPPILAHEILLTPKNEKKGV